MIAQVQKITQEILEMLDGKEKLVLVDVALAMTLHTAGEQELAEFKGSCGDGTKVWST